MQVQIVQLQQEMNLQTRKTVTFAVLELSNGKRLRMPVDETAAAAIIEADLAENGSPPSAETESPLTTELDEPGDEEEPDVSDYGAPPAQTTVLEETEHQRVLEFGGDVETPPTPPKKTTSKKNGKKKKATPAPLTSQEQAAMSYVDTVKAQLKPPEPKPQLPEGHVVPQSTQHYKKLVKEGKVTPNAFAKHVPKDDWGYPIPQIREGTADPQRVVGQKNQDEDGIGSI